MWEVSEPPIYLEKQWVLVVDRVPHQLARVRWLQIYNQTNNADHHDGNSSRDNRPLIVSVLHKAA